MTPILLHMYGPFAIHSFGVMIALGLMITLYLLHKDVKLAQFIDEQQLTNIFQISFFAGIAGGRIWFLMTSWFIVEHWTDVFKVWSGGLSISGAIIAIIMTLSLYFYYYKLPALKILDRIALYTPLLQAISRLGCFFAGCCFGQPTMVPWAVMYTHHDSLAPLCVYIHPTQIYSSLFLACSFVILMCFDSFYRYKKPGQILALYIILSSLDRFFVDFLRGDREFFTHPTLFGNLSIQQALALSLIVSALVMLTFISIDKKSDESI